MQRDSLSRLLDVFDEEFPVRAKTRPPAHILLQAKTKRATEKVVNRLAFFICTG